MMETFYTSIILKSRQKPWHKLSKSMKINRILNFIDNNYSSLDENMKAHLISLLITGINEKDLTRKMDVDYDVNKGTLININRLKQNKSGFFEIEARKPKKNTKKNTKKKYKNKEQP